MTVKIWDFSSGACIINYDSRYEWLCKAKWTWNKDTSCVDIVRTLMDDLSVGNVASFNVCMDAIDMFTEQSDVKACISSSADRKVIYFASKLYILKLMT